MLLSTMFDIQAELQSKLGLIPCNDSVEDFKYSMLALVGEIGEVLAADKRWKNRRAGDCDREEKLFELVDCMAFLINAIQYSGFTAEEFEQAFREKKQINLERAEKFLRSTGGQGNDSNT